MLYIWQITDFDKEFDFKTLELHKDKGEITNIVPIMKPVCLFGLNTKSRDTAKKPFLKPQTENSTFDKAVKIMDNNTISEVMMPDQPANLDEIVKNTHSKMYMPKSEVSVTSDFYAVMS